MVAVIVILVFLGVLLFLLMPAAAPAELKKPFKNRNFAHRGLHTADKTVPENSLAAFRAAVSTGYGIELDIQLSSDGQVVVFHDGTLDRVCGVHGKVDEFTLEQLQQMKLCGTDQTIPLFTQVLTAVNGSVPLIVEIKSGKRNDELCEKAWAILLQYSGPFCVESFDPRVVAWWRSHAKQVLRGQLASGYRDLRRHNSPMIAFVVSRCLLNCLARPHFVAYSKKRTSWCAALTTKLLGAMPVVWTARPEDDTAALQSANDAVIFEFYEPKVKY